MTPLEIGEVINIIGSKRMNIEVKQHLRSVTKLCRGEMITLGLVNINETVDYNVSVLIDILVPQPLFSSYT